MAAAEPAGRVVGRYALFDKIASGGMATVRLGRLVGPAGFSRTVAVKCLYPPYASDPSFVSMFLDEARIVARIRSPYVVPILDVVALDGELFIVMEYVPGEALSRLIRPAKGATGPVIPVPIAVAVMQNTLEGLHAAHEASSEQGTPLGIVHRDVSPQNILVGTDGLAHVIDFGVAKAAGRLQTTREGQIKGKLAYMAPEQLRGDDITRRADLYAASVVLWEMLTGQRLFHATDEAATVTRVLSGDVVPPSEAIGATGDAEAQRAAERLDAVVMRGLARKALHRFETAREMSAELVRCVAPANAAAVSDWLESVALASLAERAAIVAAIESGTPTSPVDVEALLAPATITVTDTQASHMSTVSDVVTANRRSRRRVSLAVSLALAGVALATTGGYLLRGASTPSLRPLAESPLVADASPPQSDGPNGAPSTTQPAQADSAPPAAPASAAPAATRLAPRPKTRAPGGPDCDPPFTWDEQGKKHYKTQCL